MEEYSYFVNLHIILYLNEEPCEKCYFFGRYGITM
jgi:hypothetical protein